MKNSIKILALSAVMVISSPVLAEKLDNAAVISLVELELGDEAIIAKIKVSEPNFETGVDDLISLKNKGVSSAVIAAMIDAKSSVKDEVVMQPNSPDPNAPHPDGFYYLNDWGDEARMEKINLALSDQSKAGSAFTDGSGIFSASAKVYVAGKSSETNIANNKPTFYMFIGESSAQQGNAWSVANISAVQSPKELTLVALKSKKDKREAKVGKIRWGVARGGVSDKHKIAFNSEEIREGVYKITPVEDLTAGEYGFLLPLNGTNNGGVANSRFFDFSIVK